VSYPWVKELMLCKITFDILPFTLLLLTPQILRVREKVILLRTVWLLLTWSQVRVVMTRHASSSATLEQKDSSKAKVGIRGT
jgi:hypothetical protein